MKRPLLLILAAVLLCGCTATAPAENSRTFFAMDTVMQITVYGGDEPLLSDAVAAVTDLEGKLSVTNPGSEIHQLNDSGSGALSAESAALLRSALSLCERTGGLLDVTIYPVLRSWGFTGEEYRIPEPALLQTLLEKVDYRQVQMDGASVTVPQGVMLDLGSVGKGCASDMLCDLLRAQGIQSACLNLGGNVQTIGEKPDGSAWRIGIQDPTSSDMAGILELRDLAAITSGMYQRFFVGEDGNPYGHIIDPRTGSPADSDLLSVTVVGSSGLTCDGLSTALFIAGLDEAVRFWRDSDDFEAIFITADGGVVITQALAAQFTLLQTDRSLTVLYREES